MWTWLEPHDQFRRRIEEKAGMHSHLHTKDNVGTYELLRCYHSSARIKC